MDYKAAFNPELPFPRRTEAEGVADRRDGAVYVYRDDRIALAVNVSLATRRPLLLLGESGLGKSSLARNVALRLGFRYYETVITSRTQARDLLWEVDLLRRLHDAQLRGKRLDPDITPYIKPGVLWWAFDRWSAASRGQENAANRLPDPTFEVGGQRAAVLIDEIDKAEPDVPNNLLVPLGSLQFQVEETGVEVKCTSDNAPLIFITSNRERELPAAFLRRCIQIELSSPTPDDLIEIGRAHFPGQTKEALKTTIAEMEESRKKTGSKNPLGIAKFLDTVRACEEMKITPGSEAWAKLIRMTLLKP